MPISRSGWSVTTLAAISLGLTAPDAARQVPKVLGADFPQALLAVASLAQLCVAGWVLLIVTAASIPSASRFARFATPELFRRALFVGTAGALALSPAQADRGSSPVHATSQEHSLEGLRLPDRPATAAPAKRHIVVRSGDTLWAIAARSLPATATNSEIAVTCGRWYTANRAVIGTDPDLIRPNQHLTPPAEAPTTKDVP